MRLLATLFLFLTTLAAQAGPAMPPPVGSAAPDYLGVGLDNRDVHLKQYAGKPVVISFWATWCPYCLKEMPILSGIRKASKGEVQVITINTEDRDTFRRVTRVLKDLDIDLAYDPDHGARDAFAVTGLPHMLVIGRDGKIVRTFVGYDESSLPAIADAVNRATGATP